MEWWYVAAAAGFVLAVIGLFDVVFWLMERGKRKRGCRVRAVQVRVTPPKREDELEEQLKCLFELLKSVRTEEGIPRVLLCAKGENEEVRRMLRLLARDFENVEFVEEEKI